MTQKKLSQMADEYGKIKSQIDDLEKKAKEIAETLKENLPNDKDSISGELFTITRIDQPRRTVDALLVFKKLKDKFWELEPTVSLEKLGKVMTAFDIDAVTKDIKVTVTLRKKENK